MEAVVVGLAHARVHHLLTVALDLSQLGLHEFGSRRMELRDLLFARGQLLAVLANQDQVVQVFLEALVVIVSVHRISLRLVVDEVGTRDSILKVSH